MSLVLHPSQPAAPLAAGASCPAEQLRRYLLGSMPAADVCRETGGTPVPAGLVDVRRASPSVLVLPAPSWSDSELRFFVRPEVAERLERAASVLPADLRLGFWEGLRPLRVQQALWETGLDYLRASHPGRPGEELEAALERFIARPAGMAPPHSTGSAVDVAAVNAFGQVLSPTDAWGRLGTELLARALRETGLASYEAEWWHWSYGDAEWARANDCAPLAFAVTPEFDGPGGGI